jgi:hypothetical protein
MSATGHRSSATGAGDSTCIAEKGARSDPPHDRRRVPKERDARREAQGYRGGVLFVAVVSQPVFNTPEADLACARATDQGRTRQRRDADAQVMSWRGGAGQAAIGTSSDSCGSERRAGGLGSRLKDGRADSAPCDQLRWSVTLGVISVRPLGVATNESITFRLSSALPKRFLLLSCVTRCR